MTADNLIKKRGTTMPKVKKPQEARQPSLPELKAHAYDLIALREQIQRELDGTNNLIAQQSGQPVDELPQDRKPPKSPKSK